MLKIGVISLLVLLILLTAAESKKRSKNAIPNSSGKKVTRRIYSNLLTVQFADVHCAGL